MPDELDAALKEFYGSDEEQPATDSVEEQPQADSPAPDTQAEQPAEVPSIEVDGKRYTPKEIKEFLAANLRYKDYTKKTQELAQARKAWEAERSQKDKEHQEQLEQLKKYREIDGRISGNPESLKRFKELIGMAPSPSVNAPPPEIKELLQWREEVRNKEADEQLESDLKEVRSLVGELTPQEEFAFLDFAETYMRDTAKGDVPTKDLVFIYPEFRARLWKKEGEARAIEGKKRVENKTKTKQLNTGKKPEKPVQGDTYMDDLKARVREFTGKA